MALSFNLTTYVITVPQADLGTPTGSVYPLDTNAFRINLKDWEDSEEGVVQPKTHNHNTAVSLGGIQYARVLEILAPWTITFQETGTPYVVSLIGSNNNILEKTNLGTVQILSNNSAGLINIIEVQQGVFEGHIVIDVINGVAGTAYPTGTRSRPSNNIADAKLIAAARNLNAISVLGDLTIGATEDLAELEFTGQHFEQSTITLIAGCVAAGGYFKDCRLTGVADGLGLIVEGCLVEDLSGACGYFYGCTLKGTITLAGSLDTGFIRCYDGVNPGAAEINCGGSGRKVEVRDYYGGLKISNKTGTE